MLLSPGRDPSIALDRSLIRQSTNDRVASTSSTLRSNNTGTLWGRTKKDVDWNPPNESSSMAVSRQRYLTLVHGDMETVRILPPTFTDAEMLAREWVRPPPDAMFSLRVPIEYASLQASRLIQGPYLWVSSEETYQIATTGVHGLRIEIVTDAPPPPDEPPPPPPPPVLEMPATFNLELGPGMIVALDTTCSTEDLDMSKTEDGTVVDGQFWGKMDIVHEGDTHKMEFSGTRLKNENLPSEFFFDQRVMSKLAAAARPTTARCHISVLSPSQQYCDVNLAFSPYWKLGVTWPPAERVSDNKVKFFLRVHPGGALEHFESSAVVTSLYYEAMPDTSAMDPASYITSQNGYAMPYSEFVPHLSKVLEDLGLSLQARTTFISHSVSAFALHKNIAYRFMSPNRLAAAIDLSVTTDPCVFTRIYLLYRGISDDELGAFAEAGEREASEFNWRDVVGYSEQSKNASAFRIIETSIMECA